MTLFEGGANSGGARKVIVAAWSNQKVVEGSGSRSQHWVAVVRVVNRAALHGCSTRRKMGCVRTLHDGA